MAKKKVIQVLGNDVRIQGNDLGEFICISDIAKSTSKRPEIIIQNWLRLRATVEFMGEWEKLHNSGFNHIEFDVVRNESGSNSFSLSAGEWIQKVNAVGLTTSAGRYGGTYAFFDIALHFCNWLSARFYVHIIKEFRRLKENEVALLGQSWTIQRVMTKANHLLQTTAVREHLVPIMDWNTKREAICQASEADMLNLIVWGMTARDWRQASPEKKGNIRDHATELELVVLNNLQ